MVAPLLSVNMLYGVVAFISAFFGIFGNLLSFVYFSIINKNLFKVTKSKPISQKNLFKLTQSKLRVRVFFGSLTVYAVDHFNHFMYTGIELAKICAGYP